jgi:hypothetical protein
MLWNEMWLNIFEKNLNLGGSYTELNSRALRQWIKNTKRLIDSNIAFYKNSKFEDCKPKSGENTRLQTDG